MTTDWFVEFYVMMESDCRDSVAGEMLRRLYQLQGPTDKNVFFGSLETIHCGAHSTNL